MRRKSTIAFARKHAGHITTIADALDLPMVPDILDTIDAHRGSRFIVRATSQVFKTLIGQLVAMRNQLIQPGPSAWYSHPEKILEEFAHEKFNPLFDQLQVLHPILSTDPHRRTTTRYLYPAGHAFLLLSAKVQQNRQGKTIRDLYLDEPWTYEPGWIPELSKRRGSYDEAQTWLELYMTTGTVAGTDADNIWNDSDQRTWHPRCPAPQCGKLFEPRRTHKDPTTGERIGGLIFDTILSADGRPDKGAIAASVRYRCPHCRTDYADTAANRRAMNGTAQAPRGAYVSKNASPSTAPRTFGWQCSAIALKPWAPIALQMVEAHIARTQRGDLTEMEKLIRQEDADTWDPEKYHRPQTQATYQHPTPYAMREEWPAETKDPAGRLMRFATVDVQLDYFVLIIRKWGRFSQSRLHFAALCLSPSEIALHLATDQVPPERVFFDCRHNPQRVRTICARMGWRTLMGDKEMRDYTHEDGIRRIYDKPKAIDAFTGTIHQSQTESCAVETLFSKNSALDRLDLIRAPESVHPLDGSPLWTAAADAPDWYVKQTNAHYRKRVEGANGTHHHVWQGQHDDHAGDCEAMHIVTATMASLTGAESMSAPETSSAN